MKKQIKKDNKPIIETLTNTAALALTSFGILEIQRGRFFGFLCLIFGAGLEFFKYWGRSKNLW